MEDSTPNNQNNPSTQQHTSTTVKFGGKCYMINNSDYFSAARVANEPGAALTLGIIEIGSTLSIGGLSGIMITNALGVTTLPKAIITLILPLLAVEVFVGWGPIMEEFNIFNSNDLNNFYDSGRFAVDYMQDNYFGAAYMANLLGVDINMDHTIC